MKIINFKSHEESIIYAKQLVGKYEQSCIFHCYWNGEVTEKHLISVRSCYLNNINRSNNKIIFWHQNGEKNKWLTQIERYAEIRHFDFEEEMKGTIFSTFKNLKHMSGLERLKALSKGNSVKYRKLTFLADQIRCLLLSKYGGIWFDLDIFFLRNIDPVITYADGHAFVYEWPEQGHPNNAIFGQVPKNSNFDEVVSKIHQRQKGWGFQQAKLTYDLPINLLVLPCAWFDPGWVNVEPFVGFNFFNDQDKKFTLENFYSGSFTYHWHNQWAADIQKNSIARMLDNEVKEKLSEIQ